MLVPACLRRCERLLYWIPVTIIIMFVMWSYYAYVVHFCWILLTCAMQRVVFLCLLHFQLSSSDSLLYEQERGGMEKSQILLEIFRKLPVTFRTAAGVTFILFFVCAFVSMFRLNNCIGFSNYKFFMLFLLYSLLYCLLIVTTVTPTFIQLRLGKLFDSCVKLHVLFLTLVSVMFAVTLCFLLFFHIWLLTSNKTTLVPFFVDGPASEAFDVGVWANFLQVFGKKKISGHFQYPAGHKRCKHKFCTDFVWHVNTLTCFLSAY
uniref:Palmitoyltransferase n=1 Tax=Sinocyclocheilus anshuiensis TaxID=1608454 RepID=A0A671MT22_9TELE